MVRWTGHQISVPRVRRGFHFFSSESQKVRNQGGRGRKGAPSSHDYERRRNHTRSSTSFRSFQLSPPVVVIADGRRKSPIPTHPIPHTPPEGESKKKIKNNNNPNPAVRPDPFLQHRKTCINPKTNKHDAIPSPVPHAFRNERRMILREPRADSPRASSCEDASSCTLKDATGVEMRSEAE